MIVANKSARASSTARPAAENETRWLLAVAAAFLFVHIVAMTISARRTEAGRSAMSELCD